MFPPRQDHRETRNELEPNRILIAESDPHFLRGISPRCVSRRDPNELLKSTQKTGLSGNPLSIGQAKRLISTGWLTPPAYVPGGLPGAFRDTSSRGWLPA